MERQITRDDLVQAFNDYKYEEVIVIAQELIKKGDSLNASIALKCVISLIKLNNLENIGDYIKIMNEKY